MCVSPVMKRISGENHKFHAANTIDKTRDRGDTLREQMVANEDTKRVFGTCNNNEDVNEDNGKRGTNLTRRTIGSVAVNFVYVWNSDKQITLQTGTKRRDLKKTILTNGTDNNECNDDNDHR